MQRKAPLDWRQSLLTRDSLQLRKEGVCDASRYPVFSLQGMDRTAPFYLLPARRHRGDAGRQVRVRHCCRRCGGVRRARLRRSGRAFQAAWAFATTISRRSTANSPDPTATRPPSASMTTGRRCDASVALAQGARFPRTLRRRPPGRRPTATGTRGHPATLLRRR